MRTVKESTRTDLIKSAKKLFLKKNIASVTIADIAKATGIGEATVYRYFKKKINLVMATAVAFSDELIKNYLTEDENKNGIEGIENFYNLFLDVYNNSPNYYKFIYDFDSYITQEGNKDGNEYENELSIYHDYFMKYYEKGMEDGTVKKLESPEIYYYSTSVSLLELGKKVAGSGILNSDNTYDGRMVLKNMIDLIIRDIKA